MNQKTLKIQKHLDKREYENDNAIAMGDVIAFMHALLFAYQRKLKDILGTGGAIFLHIQ